MSTVLSLTRIFIDFLGDIMQIQMVQGLIVGGLIGFAFFIPLLFTSIRRGR